MSAVPSIHESDFQRQVTDLAELLGWSYVHFRPARTAQGWRTPVQGSLGKGWPDLILVRGKQILAVELKAQGKNPTPEQNAVGDALTGAGIEYLVWWPSDFDDITVALR